MCMSLAKTLAIGGYQPSRSEVGTVLQDPERQILGTKVVSEVAFGLENLALDRAESRHGWTRRWIYCGLCTCVTVIPSASQAEKNRKSHLPECWRCAEHTAAG